MKTERLESLFSSLAADVALDTGRLSLWVEESRSRRASLRAWVGPDMDYARRLISELQRAEALPRGSEGLVDELHCLHPTLEPGDLVLALGAIFGKDLPQLKNAIVQARISMLAGEPRDGQERPSSAEGRRPDDAQDGLVPRSAGRARAVSGDGQGRPSSAEGRRPESGG